MTLAPTNAPLFSFLSPLRIRPPIFPSCFTGKNKKQSCSFLAKFSQVYKKRAVNN